MSDHPLSSAFSPGASHRTAAALLFAIALPWGVPEKAAAQRSIRIESFHSNIRVQPDGVTDVTERLRLRFNGSWNGVFRDLSLEHVTGEGRRERLRVDLLGVTDAGGNALEVDRSMQGRWTRRWKIWVPGAEDAVRTVVIRYRVHNAIRFFDEASEFGPLDELYWNVTGNGWEVPIGDVTAQVTLPQGVSPTQVATYSGPLGSTSTDARHSVSGSVVTVRGSRDGRDYEPGEGVTVAVGWAPGVVAQTAQAFSRVRRVMAGWPFALPLLAFFLAFSRWRVTGRDPDRRSISVQYAPPDDLGPTVLGTLLDHRMDMRDLTAMIVDLAVKGFLTIEEREETSLFGMLKGLDYVFHLRRPQAEWPPPGTPEHELLQGLFLAEHVEESPEAGDHATVRLTKLKQTFHKSLPDIRKAVYAELVEKGYYRHNPNRAMAPWTAGAILLGLGSGFLAIFESDRGIFGFEPVVMAVGGGGAALILLVAAPLMRARTERGARARELGEGFKEFLERVESDRYRRMIDSPAMFERFLPFAMAFGVEEQWARAFDDILETPPAWYTGPDGAHFRPSAFTTDLRSMSTAAASSMSPSGSGGGGSSGGGSGGGGGGGF